MNAKSQNAHRRRAVRPAATILTTTGMVLFATAGTATAAERTASTPAGGLTVTLTNDVVESVPSLTMMPTSSEGFVSASAVGTATGAGAQDVTSGTLDVGYQVGCAVDISGGMQLAIETLAGPTLTLFPTPGMGMNFGMTPSILINPKPGVSQDVSLGKQVVNGPDATVSFDAVHVKVDGCLGGVTVRPYAVYTVTTAGGSHSVATYGTPRAL
ncbi:MspA family porin [Rhodococcus sp. ACT016]|uniref:MspA family porin n=1 Tax=Rhodococcus sp. ACT016 TaxID=3134808 RepID=UPI003D287CFC